MDDQVQGTDSDVVEEQPQAAEVGKADILINMDQMIKNHLSAIDRLESEYKKQKDMLDDIFNNDATYKQHAETAKEANKVKAGTKAQIMKQPQVADLAQKVKTAKSELSELHAALSDYLQQYQQLSGLNEIEDETGEVREIVYTAKLIRKAFKQ